MGLHLQYIFSRMSYLIDQFNALFSTANYNSIGKQSGIQIEDLQMARLNKDLEKRGQSIGQDKIINYEMHTDGQRTFILILRSLKIDRLNFIQKITYNKKVKNWRMELNIFTDGQRFLKISKPAKVIQFIKAVSKLFKPFNFQFIKCMVNVKNGLIIFRFTDYLSINNKVREILKISQMRMDIFLQQLIKNHNIVQLLLDISSKMQNFKQGSQIPSKFIAYGKKIGIFLEFGDQRVENSMLLNESKQLQTKNQTLSSFTQISEEELRLFKLYSPYENRADLSLRQRDLQWQSKHKSEIANKIKMPGISNCINRLENNYIFNFIKISNSDSLDLRPLSHGGFAKVFSAFIQYWYVYSNSNGQLVPISDDTKFSNDKLLRKIMIVKRQSQPQNRPARRRNRVQHEIKILKQIKNSKALFVPKYYVSAEENCLGSDLLSDQLFMPNIMEYFNFHRWSTSLFTKMYILFMIVQGARYLKQSNIVHLDLKPNNIMISKSLMIKIIDYGESYHPNVCKNNHLPGLTMPYSSPQNYTSQKQFTQKSDVFSIGVMAYQIFYQRFPFFLYSEKSKAEVFLFNQYPDYWFYNHQQLQCHGDRLIFPFFQFVIGKCLDPDPNRRPQLDWLCAVIRQSFDFYA